MLTGQHETRCNPRAFDRSMKVTWPMWAAGHLPRRGSRENIHFAKTRRVKFITRMLLVADERMMIEDVASESGLQGPTDEWSLVSESPSSDLKVDYRRARAYNTNPQGFRPPYIL